MNRLPIPELVFDLKFNKEMPNLEEEFTYDDNGFFKLLEYNDVYLNLENKKMRTSNAFSPLKFEPKWKNSSRLCIKYKNLFYKIDFSKNQWNISDGQNNQEWEKYNTIESYEKKYFSNILEYGENEMLYGPHKIYYSYIIHKFENLYKKKFSRTEINLLSYLSDKYDIDDLIYDEFARGGFNCAHKKYNNELIPIIYDLGS